MYPKYVAWLADRVGGTCGRSFLCNELGKIEFYAVDKRDVSRGVDALYLREEFMKKNGASLEVEKELTETPATVLEVLVDFAEKLEDDILYIPGYDRTAKWFWMFIENLGLDAVTDRSWSNVSESYIRERVSVWLDREYKPHGENGNILVCDFSYKDEDIYDLRNMSMWEQAWKFESNSLLVLPF